LSVEWQLYLEGRHAMSTNILTPNEPLEFPFPRKKHSHRCRICGQGVYCYKTHCQLPQRIDACANCQWWQKRNAQGGAQ
jgi:hypothetical protein